MDDFGNVDVGAKISKINAAGLINLLILELWKEAYKHSRDGMLSKWNACLNCLWMEFAGDVEPGSEQEKDFKEIQNRLIATGSLTKNKVSGFSEPEQSELVKSARQYLILMDKSVFLKRLQNKQGKGTAYREDSDDYLD